MLGRETQHLTDRGNFILPLPGVGADRAKTGGGDDGFFLIIVRLSGFGLLVRIGWQLRCGQEQLRFREPTGNWGQVSIPVNRRFQAFQMHLQRLREGCDRGQQALLQSDENQSGTTGFNGRQGCQAAFAQLTVSGKVCGQLEFRRLRRLLGKLDCFNDAFRKPCDLERAKVRF